MKKHIIVVDDDFPKVKLLATVNAIDYILNPIYFKNCYEIKNFCSAKNGLYLNYYVNLISRARKHRKHNITTVSKLNSSNRLAIMINPEEENPPSGIESINKMKQISEQIGFTTDVVTYDDFQKNINNYDALFIRETTSYDNYTYAIVKRAEDNGIIVIDDSESILQCTNKIYQYELFKRNNIPTLKSYILHISNLDYISDKISYPCVIKIPDSCCSLGVFKVENKNEFLKKSIELLKDSLFILAQEYYKTEYDWRIGILNNEPLFACKYYMSDNGWQIINNSDPSKDRLSKCGRTERIELNTVPECILKTAIESSKLIGNGLYGVDLKEKDNGCVVIEINDCIDIDTPYEIKENCNEVLLKIFKTLMWRLEIKKSTY